MAAFCVSCGNPLADGARFCNKCGATQPAAAAPVGTVLPPTPASPPPPQPSKGGNTAIKIILWVVAFFVFLSLLAAGSCFYIAYRVKKRAHEFSESMHTNEKPYTGQRQPCAMLSTSEASDALGQTVASAEQRGTTVCEYTYGAHDQHFDVDYQWENGGITMGIAHGAMKHVAGMNTFTTVEGVGDETYIAPGISSLMMRKGDVLVTIDLRESGVSADAAKKMAARIAGHL
ncbi:MAG: zinc-ribbon domain-containing protein [Terriglobales bacterium]